MARASGHDLVDGGECARLVVWVQVRVRVCMGGSDGGCGSTGVRRNGLLLLLLLMLWRLWQRVYDILWMMPGERRGRCALLRIGDGGACGGGRGAQLEGRGFGDLSGQLLLLVAHLGV